MSGVPTNRALRAARLTTFNAVVEANRARRGALLIVAFGRDGTQLARVTSPVTPAGNLRVQKWSARRRRWVGPVTLRPGEIIAVGEVTEAYARAVGAQ